MRPTRVLVTGGAGFAGHHLIEHLLLTTDWEIVVLDSLTYAGRVDRLTDCEGYDPIRTSIVWHDLRAPLTSSLDRSLGDITAVLHLASASHVDRSIADPVPFVQNNVLATLHLLDWARNRDLTHFIQISTDEVYGPAPHGYRHVEWETHLPSNPYSASKAAQEDLAFAWWRTYNVPVVITNTMNMFGERQEPEKFIPLIMRHVLDDIPVPVHAQLTSTGWVPSSRHWLHARNHADALRWLLSRKVGRYPHVSRPDRWNVVGEERTVTEMTYLIGEFLDRPVNIEFVDYHTSRPGHDHRYALDGKRIIDAGWVPPVDFVKSLERTVRWTVDHQQWLES